MHNDRITANYYQHSAVSTINYKLSTINYQTIHYILEELDVA